MSFTKELQDLYIEKCKILKKIRDLKNVKISNVQRFNTVKMTILLHVTYRLKTIPIKILAFCFAEIDKLCLKFT